MTQPQSIAHETRATCILVVEDDAMLAKVVGRDLSDQGFVVSVAQTVGDALATLSQGNVDVLLTDLQLGAEDGIDLLESLREVSPRTRAVLMSGFATARDYQRAVELGAVRVLCKPFTPSELIQCIRQAIECETGFRGSVHGLSLVDMLQMFNYSRKSISIAVSGREPGVIHFRDGQIVHVEHAGLVGESALKSILAKPAGTLSTSALPANLERSVLRDFREVLLDALRAIDESESVANSFSDAELDLGALDEMDEPDTDVGATPEATPHAHVLERMRQIEGYIAACLVLSTNGGVLSYDGSLDLRPAAQLTASIIRLNQKTITNMGLDDEAEDVLITSAHQYHLLRLLHSEVPAFVHLVLDRQYANPAMAKLALASVVRSLDL